MDATFFPSPEDFRSWLEQHHESEDELSVGFYKVGTGRASMTWPQSVDEALCFGWIDGLRKKLDSEQRARFRAHETAWELFRSQPSGYQRTAIHWVISAKREQTRTRRPRHSDRRLGRRATDRRPPPAVITLPRCAARSGPEKVPGTSERVGRRHPPELAFDHLTQGQ